MPYKNHEKLLETKRRWYQKNKEKIRARARELYLINHEHSLELQRNLRIRNSESQKAYQKAYFKKRYLKNREELLLTSKIWREKNKEHLARYYLINRAHRRKVTRIRGALEKFAVISYYSNGSLCCGNCGMNIIELLTINHKYGGGAKHNKGVGLGHIYRWLIKMNYPPGFNVLCYNCNCVEPKVTPERYQEILSKVRSQSPYLIKSLNQKG